MRLLINRAGRESLSPDTLTTCGEVGELTRSVLPLPPLLFGSEPALSLPPLLARVLLLRFADGGVEGMVLHG